MNNEKLFTDGIFRNMNISYRKTRTSFFSPQNQNTDITVLYATMINLYKSKQA